MMVDEKTTDDVVDEKVVDETGVDNKTDETPAKTEESDDKTIIEKALEDDEKKDDDESDDNDDDKSKEKSEEGDSDGLKMPEGLGIDDEKLDHGLFNKLLPQFAEAGISQENLDKIVGTYAEHVEEAAKAHGDKLIENFHQIKLDWKNETQKVLGQNAKPTMQLVGNALREVGSPEFLELMQETGVGDHIAMVQVLAKIGKLFTEDSLVDGKTTTESKAEDVLYPSMDK